VDPSTARAACLADIEAYMSEPSRLLTKP
jgi:hypothetical protein